MTDKEAIEKIRKEICTSSYCDDNCIYGVGRCAYGIAMDALAEIQQYREIGTVEELARAKEYIRLAKQHGTIGQMIDECVAYEEIGTVEECREAMEKQKAKKLSGCLTKD